MELTSKIDPTLENGGSGRRHSRRYSLVPAEVAFFRRHVAEMTRLDGALKGALQLIADQQQLGGGGLKFQLSDDLSELIEVLE